MTEVKEPHGTLIKPPRFSREVETSPHGFFFPWCGKQPYHSKPSSCRGRVGIWFSPVTLGYCEVCGWEDSDTSKVVGGCDVERMRAIWKRLKEALNTRENGGVLVRGLLCREREKTKDFSCTASTTQVSISTEIRDAGEDRGRWEPSYWARWDPSIAPFLEHSTATLQRGAVRRNLRNCVIHLKAVCSYRSWWKIPGLGWIYSLLNPLIMGRAGGEKQD